MLQKLTASSIPIIFGTLPALAIFFGEKPFPFVLGLLALLVLVRNDYRSNFQKKKSLLLPYIISIIVYIVYTILSPDIYLGLKILERQTSLLVIPILAISFDWDVKKLRLWYTSFIVLLLGISIYSAVATYIFIQSNSEWIDYMGQTMSKALYLQYKFPHIINVHPTYWSYLLLAAIIGILSYTELLLLKHKSLIVAIWTFFSLNLLLLSTRAAILIYVLIHLSFLFIQVKKKKYDMRMNIIVVVFILAGTILVFNSPLTKAKIQTIETDERTEYWPLALKTIANNYFVLGEGLGQSNEVIRKHVIKYGDSRNRYKGYDLHNQFLRHYVDMGLLGLISLLYLVFGHLLSNKKPYWHYNFSSIAFLFLFFMALFTESYLIRLKGIAFFCVFSVLMAINNNISRMNTD